MGGGIDVYLGVQIKKLFCFILISIVYLFLMHYREVPKLLDTILPNGWEAQTSLGFFYTLLLFVFLIGCYDKLRNSGLTKYITHWYNLVGSLPYPDDTIRKWSD